MLAVLCVLKQMLEYLISGKEKQEDDRDGDEREEEDAGGAGAEEDTQPGFPHLRLHPGLRPLLPVPSTYSTS